MLPSVGYHSAMMKLVVVGVNYKTAPVAIREQLAFLDDLPAALQSLKQMTQGAVIVSTCNRSEIYAYLPVTTDHNAIIGWLGNFKAVAVNEMAPYLYVYEGNLAVTHWLRVAVGLDSMILGEPQILGQIKKAVAIAQQQGAIAKGFDSLIQQIFAAARTVRRDTALGKQAVSLGFATAKLVTQIFDDPTATTLLIIAAGEMNRLVAHNVASLGVKQILICNRSYERGLGLHNELCDMAKQAGRKVDVMLLPFNEIATALSYADVVSSCSGSMNALIDKSMAKRAMKERKNRTMLMVDLAVPRDIEPSVGDIDGVYLYSIDDLQHVIEGNLESRRQAAVEAELLVGQLASDIETAIQINAMGSVIAQYQTQAHQKAQILLENAKSKLDCGENADRILEEFARRLTNTLTHPPSRLLRQSAAHLDEAVLERLSQDLLGAYRKDK